MCVYERERERDRERRISVCLCARERECILLEENIKSAKKSQAKLKI